MPLKLNVGDTVRLKNIAEHVNGKIAIVESVINNQCIHVTTTYNDNVDFKLEVDPCECDLVTPAYVELPVEMFTL